MSPPVQCPKADDQPLGLPPVYVCGMSPPVQCPKADDQPLGLPPVYVCGMSPPVQCPKADDQPLGLPPVYVCGMSPPVQCPKADDRPPRLPPGVRGPDAATCTLSKGGRPSTDLHPSSDVIKISAAASRGKGCKRKMEHNEKTMDKIVALCKNRGFVYAGSEIYGGLAPSAWSSRTT